MSLGDRAAPCAVILAGVVTSTSAITVAGVLRPLQLALGIVLATVGGYLFGLTRATEVLSSFGETIGRLPQDLTFHRDDDGHLHALVSTVSGDVRTISVPDDAAGSPVDAVSFVVELLAREGES